MLRGRKVVKIRRAHWFIITRGSNNSSGGSGDGPSFLSHPKGVTATYMLTNMANYTPFGRWGVSCSCLDNSIGVHLCLYICMHMKLLLFIQFLSFMIYNVFVDAFVLMVYIVYSIYIFVHETIRIKLCVYCYGKYSYSQLYCSFNVLFGS